MHQSIDKYNFASSIETAATGMKYRGLLGYDIDFEQIKIIMQIKEYIENYADDGLEDVELMKNLIEEIKQNGMDTTLLISTVQDMNDIVEDSINEKNINLEKRMNNLSIFIVVILLILLVVIALICYSFPKRFANPIKKIAECAKKISKGDFNGIEFPDTKITEMVELQNAFEILSTTICSLISEVDNVCVEYIRGNDIKVDIEDYDFSGEFLQMALKINEMLDNTADGVNTILNCVDAFANGNFDYQIKQFCGEHAIINEKIEVCRSNFKNVIVDINYISDAIRNGKISERISTEGRTGDWLKVVTGLNQLAQAVDEPINDTIKSLNKLADAELSYRTDKKYKGAYKNITDTINSVAQTLEKYIFDISNVLKALANHDLTIKNSIKYKGDFKEIETSITTVTRNLKELVGSMASASEQIDAGAKSMANSSTALALGASEQAEAVEILVNLSNSVSDKSTENYEAAISAKDYSNSVTKDIKHGNEVLNKLNEAIQNIASASQDIGKINKVIDDIAFQTNILALNAAVEAARAGVHGKGFAVVADEVRNLASKTQESSKDSGNLIEDTINKVDDGVKAVNQTVSLLKGILNQTSKIDESIDVVLNISGEQKELSQKMHSETFRISEVVNNISSTSEETAATSEELASQIETFNQSIGLFNL